MKTNYFSQGFLFIFGLSPIPFSRKAKNVDQIQNYLEIVSNRFLVIFNKETSKTNFTIKK